MLYASTQENQSSRFANNKSADQSINSHSLISAFIIQFLDRKYYMKTSYYSKIM